MNNGYAGNIGGKDNSSRKGFDNIDKFGENTDVDTTSVPEAIFSVGGVFPFLDTGIAMDVVSTSANDDLGNTGAEKVEIQYYTTDNTKVVAEFDLDGLTQVQIADDVKHVSRMKITQTGSGNLNVGNIKAVDRATATTIYQQVDAGEGQTLSAVQLIEKDKEGIIKSHYATYARVQNLNAAQLRLRLRLTDGTLQTKYNVTISANHPRDENDYGSKSNITVDEGQYIFWEVVAVSANDTPVEAGFKLEIWDKD